jgi:hypothetical protein
MCLLQEIETLKKYFFIFPYDFFDHFLFVLFLRCSCFNLKYFMISQIYVSYLSDLGWRNFFRYCLKKDKASSSESNKVIDFEIYIIGSIVNHQPMDIVSHDFYLKMYLN